MYDNQRDQRYEQRATKHLDVLLPLTDRFLAIQRPENKPGSDPVIRVRCFLACITNGNLRRLSLHNMKAVPIVSRSQMASLWAIIREANAILPDLLMECRREWPNDLDCTPNWLDVEEAIDMAKMTTE